MRNILYQVDLFRTYFLQKHNCTFLHTQEDLFDKQFFLPKQFRVPMSVLYKFLTEEKFEFVFLAYYPGIEKTVLENENFIFDVNKNDPNIDIKILPYNINPALQEDEKVIAIKIKAPMWDDFMSIDGLFRRQHAAAWYIYQSNNHTNMDEIRYHLGKAGSYLRLLEDESLNETIIFPEAAWEHYVRIKKLLRLGMPSDNSFEYPSFDLMELNDSISFKLGKIEAALTEQFRISCEQGSLDYDRDVLVINNKPPIDFKNN